MSESVENEEAKKWEELKTWLNIQDNLDNTSNKKKPTELALVFKAIQKFGEDWFTSDNLLELLKKIKECKIDVTANDVRNILMVFKNQNQDLKFDHISKHALELIKDNSLTNDSIEREWNNFYNLLELLIDNINKNEADNLVLSDVLNKIASFTISQMTNLLIRWNKKDTKKKEDVDAILARVKDVSEQSSYYMVPLLEQLNKIYNLSKLDNPKGIPDQILNKLDNWQMAGRMCSLAKQLKGCLTVNHTKTILEKTLQANAECIYELIEQLPLEESHCELIFDKLSKSKAGDLLKLVEKLEQRIGFKFGKENYEKVLGYLDYGQTVDDIYNLLVKLKNIGVTLETNLVHDIVNKLQSKPNVNDVYKLLDNLQKIDVKLGENTAVCIVNELESGLTLDNVSTLLKKFRNINVQLNSNMDGYSNVVDAIVKKLQSPQSAQNLLDLVKTLQELNIQPIANTCKQILNLLGGDQNADDVADLLINLGNLVGFDKIQGNQSVYLPGIDDILKKIDGNQSAKDMLKLAKVLIAMGKSLQLYSKEFKGKIMWYSSNSELEYLLNLKSSSSNGKYKEKQSEFVKEFKEEIKPKKSEEKSNVGQITNSNSQDNGILNVDLNKSEELLKLKSSDAEYEEKQDEFVKEFKQEIKLKKSEEEPYVEQILNSNSQNNGIPNFDPTEEKSTSEADNKKAVLKILGGIFAILGITCIVLSLTIAESVLLGLLIPGCGLLTAGIISILVELFLNNKNDKPPINLPSGNRQDGSVISNQDDNIEPSINLETNRDISCDDDEF